MYAILPAENCNISFLALIEDKKAKDEPKEGRILRRRKQTDALDILPGSSSFYGAGMDNSV